MQKCWRAPKGLQYLAIQLGKLTSHAEFSELVSGLKIYSVDGKISGNAWLQKEFRTGLQNLLQVPEDQTLQLIAYQPKKISWLR